MSNATDHLGDQVEVFRHDWRAGVICPVMGERYRISSSTVSRYAQQLGLVPRGQGSSNVNGLYGGRWTLNPRGVLVWQAAA